MRQKLLLNPYQENETSQKGLADISTLMAVYEWQEKTYIRYDNASSSFKHSLISLYTMMLSYEAALLVHLGRNSPKQWLDSIVKSGDWSSRLKDIREQDTKCRLITTAISEDLRVKWHQEESRWQQDLLQQPRQAEESRNLRKLHSNYEAGKNVNPDRVPGTCHWFLDHVDFLTWRKSQSSKLLWLSADPGCGKSVLAKYLVDRRGEALSVESTRPTVCYFFFKDGDIERRDGAKAVCALLHQLFMQQPQLYRHAEEDFRTKSDSFLNDLDTVWSILMKAVADSSQAETVCVLDALDECQEDSRSALVAKLVQLYRHVDFINNGRPIVKFLVTSRPEFNIIRDFEELTEVRLRGEEESEQVRREIDLVIQKKVQDIGKRMRLSLSQQSSLQNTLLGIPQRTYLWLHLTFDAIEKKLLLTGKDIAAIASIIPKNVDQAYTAMLDKSPDKDMARKLLHLILAAKRPLSLQEINEAMVIDECHKCHVDLERWSPIGSADLVKNICGLFISVVDMKIYLIHQTAREFLLGEEQSGWSKSFRLVESNLIFAKACIWYLQLQDFEETGFGSLPKDRSFLWKNASNTSLSAGSADMFSKRIADDAISINEEARSEASIYEQPAEESSDTDTYIHATALSEIVGMNHTKFSAKYERSHYTLYDYVICYWANHFIEAASLPEPALIKIVANRVCDMSSQWFRDWTAESSDFLTGYEFQEFPISGAHNLAVASYLGLTAVVELLLDQGSDMNLEDGLGRTPMHIAASEGHLAAAQLLIERGAKVDSTDYTGDAPLHYAAKANYEEMTNLLLNSGTEVDLMNYLKETPLHHAAAQGSEGLVSLLIERGAYVDSLDNYAKTPLFSAISYGDEKVCKLLLKAGAKIDLVENYGESLLIKAVYHSFSRETIKLFLDHGVQVNFQDPTGQTPLFKATELEIVELLIKAGAKTDIRDNHGKTLLHHAAGIDNEAIIQTYLDLGVQVNSQDHDGRTPIFQAAEWKNPAVIEVLLKAGARTDIVDVNGETLLHHAAFAANKSGAGIWKVLDLGAQVNSQDHHGQTPIFRAIKWNDLAHIDILLRVGARADIVDFKGKTPLHRAATSHIVALAQKIMDQGVQVNSQDLRGQTALFIAARCGSHAVVKVLLERGARGDLRDKKGRTPYSMAEKRGRKKRNHFFGADYDQVLMLLR